jgi:hypothetical protein
VLCTGFGTKTAPIGLDDADTDTATIAVAA